MGVRVPPPAHKLPQKGAILFLINLYFMASVTTESLGNLHQKIVVTVGQEDYKAGFEKSIKKYAATANIPGFRKGMVPAGLVKKMYGQSVFTEEIIKQAEQKLYNYLQDEKAEIFAQPLPLDSTAFNPDVNNPTDYTFEFEVGLKPSFSPAISNFSGTKYIINVTDEMIAEDIERMQTRYGKMLDFEVVENGDNMINVTFDEVNEEGSLVENGITKTNSLLVKYFTPTYIENLKGKKVNDSIQINLADAFEAKESEAVVADLGLTKETANKFFKLTITKVGGVEKAALNEELFLAAYPNQEIKTEEEFKNAVKAEIEKAFDSQSRNQLHDQLYHHLLDNTNIELPEAFLKRWMQVGGEKKKSAEEVDAEFPSFANSLKWTLITDQLSKDNSITVEQADIKNFAKQQLFSYMNMGALDDTQPWVEDYANRMMKDKKFVEDSFYRVQTDKLFKAIEAQVTPKEETISFEDFSKKLHHHHH